MRKLVLSIFVLSVLLFPCVAHGGINLGFDKAGQAATKAGYGATDETSFAATIGIVIKAALSLVGVFFLLLMVYAGYLWMTARGEEAEVEKAQKIITAAIIGMIVIAGSYTLTAFVIPRILGKTTGEPQEAPVGGGKVECCHLCSFGAVNCPHEYAPMSESFCKASGGEYAGLKKQSECQ